MSLVLSAFIINKYLLSAYYAWAISVNKTENDVFMEFLFKCDDQTRKNKHENNK